MASLPCHQVNSWELHKSVIETSALKQCFQQREHKEKLCLGLKLKVYKLFIQMID